MAEKNQSKINNDVLCIFYLFQNKKEGVKSKESTKGRKNIKQNKGIKTE